MGHFRTVAIATAACAWWAASAVAQESAFEFNRQEWLRRSGEPAARRAKPSFPEAPVRSPSARQAPSPPASRAHAPPADFFSVLFGPRVPPSDQGRTSITIMPDGRSEAGEGFGEGPSRGGVGSYAFCVRTCDGRYFPLQGRPAASGGESGALAQCSSFCPAAKMDVYYTYASDKAIDGAVNAKGKTYTSLATAFVYRERLVPDCTCTDGKVGGMKYVDIMQDPTLRRGDIVMTATGAKVFAGGAKSRPPYRKRDFVDPERFPGLPSAMRKRIAELTQL